jgi:hypothetical protein
MLRMLKAHDLEKLCFHARNSLEGKSAINFRQALSFQMVIKSSEINQIWKKLSGK